MAPHSSTLAWKIPWMEEPGRLQFMGSQSQTRLSDFTFTFHFHALEKAMATHSSILAWRIPGMAEPGGLLSMGLHRVRHDWSDLAAAAAAFYQMFLQPKANSGNLTNPTGEKKSLSGYEATLAYAVVCQIHFSPEPFVPPGLVNVGCSQLCPCPEIALSWREPSWPVRSTLGAACIQRL